MGMHLWGSRAKLDAFLSEIRVQGYVVTPFDAEVSLRVAAPVFDVDGNYRAGLGISIATSQLKDEKAKCDAIEVLMKSVENLNSKQDNK